MDTNNDIVKIALTGGPCSGKSTFLAQAPARLGSLGIEVFRVPEMATLMINGGIDLKQTNPANIFELQKSLMTAQIALENSFEKSVQSIGHPRSVILYDRGIMDSSAYMPEPVWKALLSSMNKTVVDIRDKRYNAVIHLVTAADGAEKYYNCENNAARTESPAEARAIDIRTREAWIGHPHLRIIDNSTDFENKILRALKEISSVLGLPDPLECERKFLVAKMPDAIPVAHQVVDIEQRYLLSSDGSAARIRSRSQWGSPLYTHTIKRPKSSGVHIETERQISPREYCAFFAEADPTCRPIYKQRTCFLWEGRYFELDSFEKELKGLVMLEVEVQEDEMGKELKLPPFLQIEKEVTTDKNYSNHALARSSP